MQEGERRWQSTENDMQPREGQVIARKYTLEKLIGRGGMASVWRAHHDVLDSPVAIKLLVKDASDDLVIRFHREAQAAARLRSPNVVHVSDCGVEDDHMFIVMELLEGEDLRDRLMRVRRLDREAACGIIYQVARVLRRAHRAGIVHRDLKPANIFLCQNEDVEVVKILDFGIAKTLSDCGITAPGTVLGTPAYMSPEQALGVGEIDHRADLWSLGVMAYRMLTGVLPFPEQNGVDVMRAILQGGPPPPSRHEPTLGPAVDAFFARAFAPLAQDRFLDATNFADDLAAALGLDAPGSCAVPSLVSLDKPAPRPSVEPAASPEPPTAAPTFDPNAPTLAEGGERASLDQPTPVNPTGDTVPAGVAEGALTPRSAAAGLLAAVRRVMSLWTT
jgi:eukaryotic-like serine/threonine-protein kinase